MKLYRYYALPLLALIFTLGLTGCTDALLDGETEETAAEQDGPKLRHAHLLERAKSAAKDGTFAGKTGGNTVGVLIGLDDGIDPYRIRSRFRRYDVSGCSEDESADIDPYRIRSRFRRYEAGCYEYEHVFNGLAMEVDAALLASFLEELERDPDVAWVEPDIFVELDEATAKALAGTGQVMPWGIERIGARESWAASGDGRGRVDGVDLFVLDTGVRGEDLSVAETVGLGGVSTEPNDDHGFHVAGTAAGQDNGDWFVGVAPGVPLYSIRVFDEAGRSDVATLVAALEHVAEKKLSAPNRPMVINLSLGVETGTREMNALDEAVQALIGTGVTVVVAAGNSGIDAATVSPAHVPEAITVGAYDVYNRFAAFSNRGAAVDLLAPGVDVPSTGIGSDGRAARVLMSGTSMAAAHVSGAAALFLARNPNASPRQVHDALVGAGRSTIHGAPHGTTTTTVYIGEIERVKVPPFFQYAITSDGNLELKEDYIQIYAQDKTSNANVFTNGNVVIEKGTVRVQGFGYYGGGVNSGRRAGQTFRPNFNPTDLRTYRKQEKVEVPKFEAERFRHVATRRKGGDLELRGHYNLGTKENPVLWFVDGNVKTKGRVTFSGYGVVFATGNFEIEHPLQTAGSTEETTLGLYTSGNIELKSEGISVSAQLFSNGNVKFEGNSKVYGSVTTDGNVEFKERSTVYYRPASSALTDPFWPAR